MESTGGRTLFIYMTLMPERGRLIGRRTGSRRVGKQAAVYVGRSTTTTTKAEAKGGGGVQKGWTLKGGGGMGCLRGHYLY